MVCKIVNTNDIGGNDDYNMDNGGDDEDEYQDSGPSDTDKKGKGSTRGKYSFINDTLRPKNGLHENMLVLYSTKISTIITNVYLIYFAYILFHPNRNEIICQCRTGR